MEMEDDDEEVQEVVPESIAIYKAPFAYGDTRMVFVYFDVPAVVLGPTKGDAYVTHLLHARSIVESIIPNINLSRPLIQDMKTTHSLDPVKHKEQYSWFSSAFQQVLNQRSRPKLGPDDFKTPRQVIQLVSLSHLYELTSRMADDGRLGREDRGLLRQWRKVIKDKLDEFKAPPALLPSLLPESRKRKADFSSSGSSSSGSSGSSSSGSSGGSSSGSSGGSSSGSSGGSSSLGNQHQGANGPNKSETKRSGKSDGGDEEAAKKNKRPRKDYTMVDDEYINKMIPLAMKAQFKNGEHDHKKRQEFDAIAKYFLIGVAQSVDYVMQQLHEYAKQPVKDLSQKHIFQEIRTPDMVNGKVVIQPINATDKRHWRFMVMNARNKEIVFWDPLGIPFSEKDGALIAALKDVYPEYSILDMEVRLQGVNDPADCGVFVIWACCEYARWMLAGYQDQKNFFCPKRTAKTFSAHFTSRTLGIIPANAADKQSELNHQTTQELREIFASLATAANKAKILRGNHPAFTDSTPHVTTALSATASSATASSSASSSS